jgi:hypothetical protein
VVEERTNSRLADAGRVAESLLSPGSPVNWQTGDLADVRQIGIATAFGNELDIAKVSRLNLSAITDYEGVGRLLRAGGDYFILIESNDGTPISGTSVYGIGRPYYLSPNATVIAVANRGVTYIGADGNSHAARLRVFLYK